MSQPPTFPFRVLPAVVLFLAAGCAPVMTAGPQAAVPSLATELDSIFDEPTLAHAHWGVLARSLDTGETIYARNAGRLFLPASNMKLVTGAAALETVGPDYTYVTTFAAGGPYRSGSIEGPLVVTGTGDPSFGGRFHERPRDAMRAIADSLRVHGVTRIAGGIIAVDTAFADPHLGDGWMWNDLAGSSSAEFGALQFNDGVIDLEIFPGSSAPAPAIVVLDPATQYVRVTNLTRTMPEGSNTAIRIEREESGAGIIVRGEVAADAGSLTRRVAVREPGLYFVSVLREVLRESGIAVEGPAIHYRSIGLEDPAIANAFPVFMYRSPPMDEVVTAMMKPSQNQIAEMILRTVDRESGGEGTARGARVVLDSLFTAWEFENTAIRVADGSGLSRYDLLSPAFLVELLEHMDRSFYREEWIASLPIAGRDGTLASRMRDEPLFEQVLAKTGTLGNVRALSGYLTTQRGERIAFSMLINANLLGSNAADRVAEAALARIAVGQ